MNIMLDIAILVVLFVSIKALLIGSEFSFYHWTRDGEKYSNWYNNRKSYKEYKQLDDVTY